MQNKIFINCDGGSRGNPGPAAIGLVIWDKDHNKLEEYKECIGNTTNNVAEYNSLIKSLELASKHTDCEVFVFMDSELVIRQITGQYKVRAPHLIPLFNKIKELEKNFSKIVYDSVRRSDEYQVHADRLVNMAMDGY